MANKRSPKKTARPKAVLRLPDLDQAKSAVLNSRSSRGAQRRRRAQDLSDDWDADDGLTGSYPADHAAATGRRRQ